MREDDREREEERENKQKDSLFPLQMRPGYMMHLMICRKTMDSVECGMKAGFWGAIDETDIIGVVGILQPEVPKTYNALPRPTQFTSRVSWLFLLVSYIDCRDLDDHEEFSCHH